MENKISVIKLKNYLNEVGITVTALSKLSDINVRHLQKCLSGEIDIRDGRVRTLSNKNVERLQDALHQLSLNLKYIFIFYNKEREVVRRNGRCYCPECVEQIKQQLSPYFNILTFMQYSLNWSRSKIRNIMEIKGSYSYGNISEDDCNRINITITDISARLDTFTLIKD